MILSMILLLQYLIGSFDPPNSSSHYDFIIRLTGFDPHLSDLAPQSFITKKNFKNKPAKGEKLINFTKDDTSSICDKYRNGAEFDRGRLLFTMQSLFNAITKTFLLFTPTFRLYSTSLDVQKTDTV